VLCCVEERKKICCRKDGPLSEDKAMALASNDGDDGRVKFVTE
jgi:hypothetical protein